MAETADFGFLKVHGKESWNERRKKGLSPNPDLRGQDLSKMDLTEIDLENVRLEGADLDGATLIGAILRKSILHGASVNGTDFGEADLREAQLNGIKGETPSFRKADLSQASMDRAQLVGASFSGATMAKTSLADSILTRPDFSDAGMGEVSFDRATISGGLFVNCGPSASQFRDGTLRDTQFQGKELLHSNFTSAKIVNCSFSLERMDGISFNQGELEGIELHSKDIQGLQLMAANPIRLSLAGSVLRASLFRDSVLEECDLSHCQFSGCDFRGTKFPRSNLDGAKLLFCRMEKTGFSKTLVHKTTLEAVDFGNGHDPLLDGSEEISLRPFDRIFRWSRIRFLTSLPFFELSYFALFSAVLLILAIGYLNSHMPITVLDYPIPVPGRIALLLGSSVTLGLGVTLFRLLCPPRIRESSETYWVEQARRPRLLYLVEDLQPRFWGARALTFSLTGIGGILGLVLLFERLFVAMRVLFSTFSR